MNIINNIKYYFSTFVNFIFGSLVFDFKPLFIIFKFSIKIKINEKL